MTDRSLAFFSILTVSVPSHQQRPSLPFSSVDPTLFPIPPTVINDSSGLKGPISLIAPRTCPLGIPTLCLFGRSALPPQLTPLIQESTPPHPEYASLTRTPPPTSRDSRDDPLNTDARSIRRSPAGLPLQARLIHKLFQSEQIAPARELQSFSLIPVPRHPPPTFSSAYGSHT